MCRLFGLTAGRREVGVKYWLVSGPDSMKVENRCNPDGADSTTAAASSPASCSVSLVAMTRVRRTSQGY